MNSNSLHGFQLKVENTAKRYSVIALLLDLPEIECYKRIVRVESQITKLLLEYSYELEYDISEVILNSNDLSEIINMIVTLKDDLVIKEDTFLEKILLYYYIMHIVHRGIGISVYEEFLEISGFLKTFLYIVNNYCLIN